MQGSLLEFKSNVFKVGFICLFAVSWEEAALVEGTSEIVRVFHSVFCPVSVRGDLT